MYCNRTHTTITILCTRVYVYVDVYIERVIKTSHIPAPYTLHTNHCTQRHTHTHTHTHIYTYAHTHTHLMGSHYTARSTARSNCIITVCGRRPLRSAHRRAAPLRAYLTV